MREQRPRAVRQNQHVGRDDLAIVLRDRPTVGGSFELDGRLEPRQIGDQARLAVEVLEERLPVLLDQRRRLFEAAHELALGLRGDRAVTL